MSISSPSYIYTYTYLYMYELDTYTPSEWVSSTKVKFFYIKIYILKIQYKKL